MHLLPDDYAGAKIAVKYKKSGFLPIKGKKDAAHTKERRGKRHFGLVR